MSKIAPSSGVGAQERRAAELDAVQAASRAQVEIVVPKDDAGARLVADAGDQVWGSRGTFKPNELRALMHAGDPVQLAVDVSREPHLVVGFAVGFLGWSPVLHVHSHQVGVVDGHRGKGVGLALKLAQRQTCLANDITEIRWTFDPLVRRNVSFNLAVLGARAAAFYADFYGQMDDAINGGDATDRLEAVWGLDQPLPDRGGHDTGSEGETIRGPHLLMVRDGRPELTGAEPCPGAVMAVPPDYDSLRREDRSLSRAWRETTREVLRKSYGMGLRIGRVTDAGYEMVGSEQD